MKKERDEKYMAVVKEERLKKMQAFCIQNNIKCYAEFMVYCMFENNDWFKTASSYGGCRAMRAWFARRNK